ncbi:hypothetical protein Tco_0407585 [Tanacetum coccineum]
MIFTSKRPKTNAHNRSVVQKQSQPISKVHLVGQSAVVGDGANNKNSVVEKHEKVGVVRWHEVFGDGADEGLVDGAEVFIINRTFYDDFEDSIGYKCCKFSD